ncbi:transposase [uncultured Jannaschia sp.]|uniref:transposase n=1 Tax=uncultured Jannaschia sp. TaxID=293347 RepID=UPI00342CA926
METQLALELEPKPGKVAILDNLSTRKASAAADAPRKAGCWFLFLPAHSPNPNPIGMAFAKLKVHLRRIGAQTSDDIVAALGGICGMFTSDERRNYLRHAGYASTL